MRPAPRQALASVASTVELAGLHYWPSQSAWHSKLESHNYLNRNFTYLTDYSLRECLSRHLGLLRLCVAGLLVRRHSHVSASSDRQLLCLRLLLVLGRITCNCLSHLLVLLKALILRKLDILDSLLTHLVQLDLLRHCSASRNLLEVLLHAY